MRTKVSHQVTNISCYSYVALYLLWHSICCLKFWLFEKEIEKSSSNNAHVLTFLWSIWVTVVHSAFRFNNLDKYIHVHFLDIILYFHDYFSISCIYPVLEFWGFTFYSNLRVIANGVEIQSTPSYSHPTPFHSFSLSPTASDVVSLLQLMNPHWHIMVTQSS